MCQHLARLHKEIAAMDMHTPTGSRMLPTDRIDYSAIAERARSSCPAARAWRSG